jgi:hypothetical protein
MLQRMKGREREASDKTTAERERAVVTEKEQDRRARGADEV